MTQVTVTLNGRTATLSIDAAKAQIAKSEAALSAMTPIAAQNTNKFATATEIANAQTAQDARRAMHETIIVALAAAIENASITAA